MNLFKITYYYGGKQHSFINESIEKSLTVHYDLESYNPNNPKPIKGFFAEILPKERTEHLLNNIPE